MEFCRLGKNDINSLVKMRIMYLREDFTESTDEQFTEIEKNLYSYFEKHLNNDLFAFGAMENDNIISTALLLIIEKPCNPRFITGKTGEVFSVYTLPEYRRQGNAMKIMEMLLNFSKEINLDIINLKATHDGLPMYKKIGFIEDNSNCTSMKYIFV